MSRPTRWFLLAVLVQVGLLLAVPATKVWTRATGRTIVLPLVPVDPYDPARGYHLVLNYEIASLEAFPHSESWPRWGTFFAVVREDSTGVARPVRLVGERPAELPPDEIAIRGTLRRGRPTYGIETFYIPEADRDELETLLRENASRAVAIVKVARTGDAALIGLRVGDREI